MNLLSTSHLHLIPLQWNLDVSGAVAAALPPLGNKYMGRKTEGQDVEEDEGEGYRELVFAMAS